MHPWREKKALNPYHQPPGLIGEVGFFNLFNFFNLKSKI
jgi:hypothetical protein